MSGMVHDKAFYDWVVENSVIQLEDDLVGSDTFDIELVNCTKWGWIKGAWTLKNASWKPGLKRHSVGADEVVDHVEMTVKFEERIPWPWHRRFCRQFVIWGSMIWRWIFGDKEECDAD